jgi:putative membrane protein
MKISKMPFAVGLVSVSLLLVAACKSNKNSTAAADSANAKIIAATDSVNKAGLTKADSSNKAQTSSKEDASKFLVDSYENGLYEVQLSNLAATNALSPEVKTIASTLVIAHSKINAKIQFIARKMNFVLPDAVNSDHHQALQDFNSLRNADFDKKYIDVIVDGHKKSVDNYKSAYKNLKPGETKTFAAQTLPLIEQHLDMAKKVQKDIK